MTKISRQELIKKIRQEVHLPLNWERYKETLIQHETNCYSHAIGATSPNLEIYRIGAVSGKKTINERYTSISEILVLLKEDMDALELQSEMINGYVDDLVTLRENEHAIRLYVKTYANGMIGDYHFIRWDEGFWTEKWRGARVAMVTSNYYESRWEWRRVLDLKITR